MPIYIDDIELPEPVEIELKYDVVKLYDKPSITGKLHRKYKSVTKFEDTVNEYDTIKFQEVYELNIYNLTIEQYQALEALDGTEVSLRIRRGLVLEDE
jgi:hypothetical protein